MAPSAKTIASCGLLAVSGGYAISQNSDKTFALVGFVMYCVNGISGLAYHFSSSSDMNTVHNHITVITRTAALDCLATEVCIIGGIEKKYALINLIPPVVDLLFWYVIDSSWDFLTKFTHIASLAAFGYFGAKEKKWCLIISAVFYLFGYYTNRMFDPQCLILSFAVFFAGWSISGKDLKDLGLDVYGTNWDPWDFLTELTHFLSVAVLMIIGLQNECHFVTLASLLYFLGLYSFDLSTDSDFSIAWANFCTSVFMAKS